ncbi:hypothetical protein BDZ91DRAFT_730339 [Kalaharituber pfeilii]|nr:hypothetical protein BDZ91DRAFT_730339 [Kalaharituber pfeilii]
MARAGIFLPSILLLSLITWLACRARCPSRCPPLSSILFFIICFLVYGVTRTVPIVGPADLECCSCYRI